VVIASESFDSFTKGTGSRNQRRRRSRLSAAQSFGAVMGMDWHSSGITTSVIGALKRRLTPLERELGIHVCGGRGNYRQAREPAEPPPAAQPMPVLVGVVDMSLMAALMWHVGGFGPVHHQLSHFHTDAFLTIDL